MTYYKVTDEGGKAFHGGSGSWPLPSDKRPGKFLKVDGPIVACRHGLHFCREDQLLDWLGPVVWEFEPRGDILDAGDKLVCAQGRLVRRCEGWNERTARLFAVDCATRALTREKRAGRTPDRRSYEALKVARRFANGDATDAERAAARAAARDAAWRGGGVRVRVSHAAARALAWDAASAAAGASAWDAASARAAAWDAASAGDAAWDAERRWQTKRLMEYVTGVRS